MDAPPPNMTAEVVGRQIALGQVPTPGIQLRPAAMERLNRRARKEEQKRNPTYCKLDDRTVRSLLTRDFICRQTRSWKLLSRTEMARIYQETSDLRIFNFPTALFENSGMGDFYWINRQIDFPNINTKLYDKNVKRTLDQTEISAFKKINKAFPLTKELLQEFSGRLIVAGGAVFKNLFFRPGAVTDIDFFFIDPEVERIDVLDQEKVEKANVLLEEVVGRLVGQYLCPGLDDVASSWRFGGDGSSEAVVFILRNEHVVTVHVRYHSNWMKYQFIKRVYPSEASVFGGFDLGTAMIGYRVDASGKEELIGTELGIWSAFASTIIVDTSRRSTSFEHRLVKYNKKCHLIFPGLAKFSVPAQVMPIRDLCIDLRKMSAKIGLWASGDGKWKMETEDSLMAKGMVLAEIAKLTAKFGYRLENLNELSLVPVNSSDSTVDSEIRFWECLEMLKAKAWESSYRVDVHELGRGFRYPLQEDEDQNYDGLNHPEQLLRLPYLDISYSRAQLVAGTWKVLVSRKVGVLLGDQLEPRHSDYENNDVWSVYVVDQNLTKLVHGKLSDVVSVVCLKKSTAPLDDMPGEDRTGMRRAAACLRMESCVIDVDRSPKSIKDLVKESLRTTDVGDVLRSFRERATQIWEYANERKWNGLDLVQGANMEVPKKVFGDQAKKFAELVVKAVARAKESKGAEDKELEQAKEAFFLDMEAKVTRNVMAVQDKLASSGWILRNQGRQWTSSNNPIMRHPKDWYGERYRSFRIGCKEVETTLRLIRLRKGNDLQPLPLDVFKIILIRVVWANSFLF